MGVGTPGDVKGWDESGSNQGCPNIRGDVTFGDLLIFCL